MASTTPSSTRSAAPATASGLRTRLLKSSSFRLTVAYLLVFGLSALALLAFVYGLASNYIERQTLQTIGAEIEGLREQEAQGGVAGLTRAIEQRAGSDPARLGLYLLVDWNGRFIAGNLTAWPDTSILPDSTLRFTIAPARGGVGVRRVVARAFSVDRQFRLLVGRDVSETYRTQQLLWSSILVGAGVMLLLGLGGGFVLSRWTLGRLEQINRSTAAIMAGELGRRIEVEGGGDEFDELALNLNAMLERIERLLTSMREVTDNIAHDLRTPLTRIRSRLEVALMKDLEAEEARHLLEATMHDAEKLIETFNALLSITRAEAGTQRSEWERFDLTELALDVFDLYEPLAEEKDVTVRLDAPVPVLVLGNKQLTAQAIANLADNAIKYTPHGGRVSIATADGPPRAIVADNGPGVPPELRPKVLERFYRLEEDRSSPGNGLGLSLVAAVARLHDAVLELDENPGGGLRIALVFKPPPPEERAAEAEAVTMLPAPA